MKDRHDICSTVDTAGTQTLTLTVMGLKLSERYGNQNHQAPFEKCFRIGFNRQNINKAYSPTVH